jgi:8-oxo-dGTP diphosphatase
VRPLPGWLRRAAAGYGRRDDWASGMSGRSGNGWVTCEQEHQHWGLFGAAGLLAFVPGPDSPGGSLVLLQHRAKWSHEGGTWSLPGGAMDSEESPAQAALREADEECFVDSKLVVPRGLFSDEHGGWVYHTVVAQAQEPFKVFADAHESDEARWLPAREVDQLELHPGFAAYWPLLRQTLLPLTIIVDGASVLARSAGGPPASGPGGPAGDAAAAAGRLKAALAGLAETGLTALPGGLGEPALARWYPDYVLVLDGDARAAAAEAPADPAPAGPAVPSWSAPLVVRTAQASAVAAPGAGADEIAGLTASIAGRRLVITADPDLRERVTAAGAVTAEPGWLLPLL